MTDKDKTLRKGLQILDLLSASDGPRGAADIARELELTRSNTFRLMTTLTDMGYLRRADETGRYEPTLKSWEIGMRIMGRNPLRRVAQPFLRSLHEATGFNTYLSILDGLEILYLDKVESETQSQISAQPGTRLPAFLVASGHAILASTSNQAVLEGIAGHPRASEMDRETLISSLEHARETGWAMTISGSRPGVTSIAAAVRGFSGGVAAAIAVSAPSRKLDYHSCEIIAHRVLDKALKISDAVRY